MSSSARRLRATVVPVVALAAAGLWPARVSATVVGSIFSGPTSADPMVTYWNPAAMTLLEGTTALLHGGMTALSLGYQRSTPSGLDGLPFARATMDRIKPELAVGLVTDATLQRFRFGFGFALPVVDGATWAESYEGRPSSTRYFAVDAMQAHLMFRAAAAYRVHRLLSVGLGLDVVAIWFDSAFYTDLGARLNQATCQLQQTGCVVDAPLQREDPAYQSYTRAEGLGAGVGVNASLLLTPAPWLRLGLAWHSGAGDVSIPANISVELPPAVVAYVQNNLPVLAPALPQLGAAATFSQRSPMMITAGLSLAPHPRLELAGDLHWVQKSKMTLMLGRIRSASSSLFQDLVLVRAARDDYYVGGRVSYRFTPALSGALRLEYNPNMRPERFVTPTSIDYDKIQLQLGASWAATSHLTVVVEYGHYFLFAQQVRQSAFAPNANPTTALEAGFDVPSPLGRYDGFANRLTVALLLRL